MKKKLKAAVFIIACILAFSVGYSLTSLAANDDAVKIGHRNFTEERLVGQLLSVYLESKGYKTEVIEIPSINRIFNALQNGDIDVYGEYTGTLYTNILNESESLSKDQTYNHVKEHLEKEYGITLLKPLGWNNTYVLSVRPETAKKYHLKTISDVVPFSNQMSLGSDEEFAYRKDGLIGLLETYRGLNFQNIKPMDQALTYQALFNGQTDVNASYSTDARIEKFGLVNLIDDKNYFPAYYLTPLLKMDFAEKNPEIVTALEKLENQWTDAEITKYNQLVDEGQEPRAVAEIMLRNKGLI